MATLPDGTLYGFVEGSFGVAKPDGPDDDDYQDYEPAIGTVTFTPAFPQVFHEPTDTYIFMEPETIRLNADGKFKKRLVASDSPGLNPQGLYYKVKVSISGHGDIIGDVVVSADTTVKFSKIVGAPAPPNAVINYVTYDDTELRNMITSATAQVTTVEKRVRTNPELPAAWGLFDPNGRGFGVWMPDGSLDTIPLKAITQQLGMSRATSGPDLLAVGTSLTANVDSSSGSRYASSWPIVLGGLIGRDAVNRGWSGRNSRAISVMFGATPWQTTAAITLPSTAGGTVDVPTDVEVDYLARPASIAGVLGTIKRGTTATTGVFTRTNAGDAWPIPAGTTVWCRPVEDYSDRILIIECSRNDDPSDITGIIDRTRRIITTLTAGVTNPRVLVHGQPLSVNDTPAQRAARMVMNDALRAEFRAQYVDSWAYLRSDACANVMGLTWTTQDRADIAAGITPKSIRLDDLHPNNAGHQALAYFFRDEITRRGWTA